MATYGTVILTVKRWFARGEPFTISRIHELTGYARRSIETAIHRLEREGYLVKLPHKEKVGVGRPQVYYQLTSDEEKRQEFLEMLHAFELELPISTVPTGVHYPLLVEEINKLAIDPDIEINSDQVDELLEYIWDVYLEEGGEEASEAVRMHLQLQEVRLKWLSDRITSEEAIEEFDKLQVYFNQLNHMEIVREIEEFQRVMVARQNYRAIHLNEPSAWITQLLDSFSGEPRENLTFLERMMFAACERQMETAYSQAIEPYQTELSVIKNYANAIRQKQFKFLIQQDDVTGVIRLYAEFHMDQPVSYNPVTTPRQLRTPDVEDFEPIDLFPISKGKSKS